VATSPHGQQSHPLLLTMHTTRDTLSEERQAGKKNFYSPDGIGVAFGSNGEELEEPEWPPPPANIGRRLTRSFLDYSKLRVNPADTLLGNRFLCRRGSCTLFGSAGQGKSLLVVQAGSHWSVGLPFFGIKCNGPLRILYVQAEDDEGDMIEQTQVVNHLNFTSEQLKLLGKNTRMERVNGYTGKEFVKLMDGFIQEWPPDMLVINPLQSFIGGDLKDDKLLTPFLRIHLDGLLNKFNIGVLGVGHTTKQSSKDIGKMDRLQRMYAIAGSAQMANWPRSMLFLANTDSVGIYDLWAVKKWQRVWASGTDYVKLAHAFDDKLLWKTASIEQQFESMAKVNLQAENLLPFIPLAPEVISFVSLAAKLNGKRDDPIGQVKIHNWLALLEERKDIKVIGKGPKTRYQRIKN
jgi:hypothetical protein